MVQSCKSFIESGKVYLDNGRIKVVLCMEVVWLSPGQVCVKILEILSVEVMDISPVKHLRKFQTFLMDFKLF